jgi:hypothetical protein
MMEMDLASRSPKVAGGDLVILHLDFGTRHKTFPVSNGTDVCPEDSRCSLSWLDSDGMGETRPQACHVHACIILQAKNMCSLRFFGSLWIRLYEYIINKNPLGTVLFVTINNLIHSLFNDQRVNKNAQQDSFWQDLW